MRKTSFIFATVLFSLMFSVQLFGQPFYRDIAVVGHNLNHQNNLALEAVNTVFNGWTGLPTTFQVITQSPPRSWLKNKITGAQLVNCNAVVDIINVPGIVDYNIFGGAELLLNGVGSFNVTCGATILTGRFDRAILHVTNGSRSASLTLLRDSVTYLPPTNLINNLPGNFSFSNGSFSIGIVSRDPILVDQLNNTISGFKGFGNITFGAAKL